MKGYLEKGGLFLWVAPIPGLPTRVGSHPQVGRVTLHFDISSRETVILTLLTKVKFRTKLNQRVILSGSQGPR